MRATLHFDDEERDDLVKALAADELALALCAIHEGIIRERKQAVGIEREKGLSRSVEIINSCLDDYPLAKAALESLT